ncbi:alanine/glycine:cation symporter family protein [Calorimonas adulescens]|jgi:amino acid carrier protein|uniref:Sodium:alanine symporter family protein n=1 Tax=Calorimonas adulescens TaxID=2606906 RepID=A0A5D8Q9Q0_9THEO|nr:sodium:alanine symporter family protein [Calorimonas adulescens]TZE81241.1 sodium:alanine symporter family protein [Calorimonas adulescens]
MEWLLNINKIVNGIVWGPPMLILIVGTGIFLTLYLGFPQVTKFGYIMKNTLLRAFSKKTTGEGDITPFQAVATALAATVGTGNIAGVATAIFLGGPGAIFWMWLSAFFGMVTKYSEVCLSVNYRVKNPDGSFSGGPMYYISNGLNAKWLAYIFAVFGALAAFGIGNMVQANSTALSLKAGFGIRELYTGIALAVLTGLVIIGGVKRIGQVTEYLVPFMAIIYVIGSLVIILLHIDKIPEAFAMIFENAFTPTAASGGFAGATIMMGVRYGVARGVFSNEAGLGSAPIAHAAATVDHPVKQGIYGVFEVFMDTIVICTMTALVILTTGVWNSGKTSSELSMYAFETGLPGTWGKFIVVIGLALFAYSTIIGWSYYGEKCVEFLFGPKARLPYRIIWLPFIGIGAVGGLTELWNLADTLNGLMAIPNLIGVLLLSGVVRKLTKEYFSTH